MAFAEKLTEAIRARNSVLCAGIDPHLDRIPKIFRQKDPAHSVRDWVFELLPLLAGQVPVIKPQVAFFETLGVEGYAILRELSQGAHGEGLLTIMDAKRGDIDSTADAYAEAWLGKDANFGADALTINPYLGLDSLVPFTEKAAATETGLFILLRTSNQGSNDIQMLNLENGKPLFHHVADMLKPLIDNAIDASGFSSIGVVMGANFSEDAAAMRRQLPAALFLIPGFGAQGGAAADACAGLVRGEEGWEGGIVNSARALTMPDEAMDAKNLTDWRRVIRTSIDQSITALR